ncbi:MAG: 4-hydroxy-3-methylbut-2-enyl diphosphate reductase [Elusimicrobia bacterium]|nr:4-hydroxy-3-methylbut-2-enyl diphosphate reductase [Elusimicrobiota bacterium]
MRIIVAKNSGFCFGVRRAINLALNLSEKSGDVYTIGPIIHNPQVVKELSKKGINVIKKLGNIRSGNIIIRAHGIPRQTLESAKKRGIKILDATCPYVTRSKKYVEELTGEGYRVIIIGNPHHPEMKYIASYAPRDSVILKPEEMINKKLRLKQSRKLGIITQTTQSPENFIKTTSKLLNYSNEFKIFNTICPDATNRQTEAVKLAKRSDVMIVIGGKNSANTNRLAAISKEIQPNTYHIEMANEIKSKWFKETDTIGIVAGASTPDWIIKEVVNKIRDSSKTVK